MSAPGILRLCVLLGCLGVAAQAPPVPEALDGWRGWVLDGHEYLACPFRHDSDGAGEDVFVCTWPGELRLTAAAGGGTFEQTWTVLGGDRWVALPGDAEHWPRDVTVDGRPAVVVRRPRGGDGAGAPAVRLSPGEHRVGGRFAWTSRPTTLAVPPRVGLLALELDGERIAVPGREKGELWLGEGEKGDVVADSLDVEVYRLVSDDVPVRLETLFMIDVAGGVREERIAPVLPAGFVPLAVESELAVRFEPGGAMRVQLRPGRWSVALKARAEGVVERIVLPASEGEDAAHLPGREIWSYRSNPRLRATTPAAGRPVDPALVRTPWRELPAFGMEPGDALEVVERGRGTTRTDNDIAVERSLWLDFDGAGFVFSDSIGGTMRHGWRMDMAPPYALQSATERGHDLLVTRSGDGGAGIELRVPELDVRALGRLEGRGEVPASGWRDSLDSLSATLYLPPGQRLAAALGVDAAPQSWFGRWRLLDFFVLLVATVAAARLFGAAAGAVALAGLALSFHEPGAPVWTWLNLLAACGLARVAPEGRLRTAARNYRLASFAVLLVVLVPFAASQVRSAVYPQLAPPPGAAATTMGLFEMLAGERLAVPGSHERTDVPVLMDSIATDVEEMVVTGSYVRRDLPRYDDSARLQTGPGRPDWRFAPHDLAWSGPVDPGRAMRLVVMPAWAVSAVRFLAALSLAAFALLFLFDMLGRQIPRLPLAWLTRNAGAGGTGVMAAAAIGLAGLAAERAAAELPTPALLDELEQRLLAPPPCVPRCAEIVSADVDIDGDEMTIRLEVHALADIALPLPGSLDGWRPARIADGTRTKDAMRDARGVLRIRLAPGLHNLVLNGPMPSSNVVEVPFPARPRVIAARADEWFVAGIDRGRLAAGSLELTRRAAAAGSDGSGSGVAPSALPAFVRVERSFSLQLDWRITTVVHRVAPVAGAINVELPLVAGESVIDAESITVADSGDLVRVAMSPSTNRIDWSSNLPRTEALMLEAAADAPWREVWHFRVASSWRVRFSGLPESGWDDGDHGDGLYRARFDPRPGERLEVAVERPEGVAGETLALDHVRLSTDVGARQRNSTLELDYRSTRAGSQRIGLPPGARLTAVLVDGRAEPLALEDGGDGPPLLSLPVSPGEHATTIFWEEDADVGAVARTPAVSLGAPASNIVLNLAMPESRWLLYAGGPGVGPAILYWSELVALVLAGLALGRVRQTPLRSRHWILVGLGFSTFSWIALGVVAAWLLAHGFAKAGERQASALVHNLRQVGLGLATLAAAAALLTAIPAGLLGSPDMHVVGFESAGRSLGWFADQSVDGLPRGSVWSLPMWTYKALILAWSVWLAYFVVVRCLPWVWQRFASGGLWRPRQAAAQE